MSTWIALAIVAIGSYLFRLAPLIVLERFTIPRTIESALTYAGPAAITALTVSAVLHGDVTGSVGASAAATAALAVAGLLALWRRPFLVAVGAGLALYALLDIALL